MDTDARELIDQKLRSQGRYTIGGFCQKAEDLAERRSADNKLPIQLNDWVSRGCVAAELQTDILTHLEAMRRALAQRQFRCDGNEEHLDRTYEAIVNGEAAQHVLDTMTAHRLIKWCRNFAAIAKEVSAVV